METGTADRLLISIANEANELMQLLLLLDEGQMNTVPFKDSWTAAQLATHVTKSNKTIAQALAMAGKAAERDAGEKVRELRDTFLNFSIKLKSPDFIIPGDGPYKKEEMISALKKSNEELNSNAVKADVNEMINLPAAFGEITKLELLHFVVYHTQRHIHQLKKIVEHLEC